MGSLALVNRIAPAEQHANVLASFYVTTYLGVGIPIVGVGFLAGGIGLYPRSSRLPQQSSQASDRRCASSLFSHLKRPECPSAQSGREIPAHPESK
ncbi:MAG: hypothetical protein NVS4B11_13350 [Ktedonobacteraceae bacterium]